MITDPLVEVTALIGSAVDDTGQIALFVIGAVLTVAVVLIGAGYGWRLLKRHVTGRKI